MLFTAPKKQLDSNLKTKLNGKKLYETDSKIWESELIKLDLETTGWSCGYKAMLYQTMLCCLN